MVQGVLFVLAGAARRRLTFGNSTGITPALGWVLAAHATLLYPLLGQLAGHGYTAQPIFGIRPCPVRLFTFSVLLLTSASVPRWLAQSWVAAPRSCSACRRIGPCYASVWPSWCLSFVVAGARERMRRRRSSLLSAARRVAPALGRPIPGAYPASDCVRHDPRRSVAMAVVRVWCVGMPVSKRLVPVVMAVLARRLGVVRVVVMPVVVAVGVFVLQRLMLVLVAV